MESSEIQKEVTPVQVSVTDSNIGAGNYVEAAESIDSIKHNMPLNDNLKLNEHDFCTNDDTKINKVVCDTSHNAKVEIPDDQSLNVLCEGSEVIKGCKELGNDTNETEDRTSSDIIKETESNQAGASCELLESFEDLSASEESGSEGEYESAEEGEELNVDAQHLRDIEESLTEEEKEERRQAAQSLKEEGNEMFKNGSYKTAIRTYSRALRTCPLKFKKERAIMYSNRAACKLRLEDKEEAIRDCTKALDLHPHYTKALLRRAELYEATDKLEDALKDFEKVLELDPSQHSARAACLRLPDQIKERNEKLKEEMMGKLKELGNMVLRPFGLSTNNFQLNQDPNTGGYSVNFVQKKDA